ncbi:MAG: hypothetical protein C4330_01090 [Chitinophagaceae bacterium]
MVESKKGQTLDARLKGKQNLTKGSTETRVDIYVNGKLVQVESYDQIKIYVPLDSGLFDPANASSSKHWFK